jgi:hypothetical protein
MRKFRFNLKYFKIFLYFSVLAYRMMLYHTILSYRDTKKKHKSVYNTKLFRTFYTKKTIFEISFERSKIFQNGFH